MVAKGAEKNIRLAERKFIKFLTEIIRKIHITMKFTLRAFSVSANLLVYKKNAIIIIFYLSAKI